MQVLSCTIKSLIFKINKDLFLTVWHLCPTLTVPKIFRDTTRNISRSISFSSTFHVKVYIAEMLITFFGQCAPLFVSWKREPQTLRAKYICKEFLEKLIFDLQPKYFIFRISLYAGLGWLSHTHILCSKGCVLMMPRYSLPWDLYTVQCTMYISKYGTLQYKQHNLMIKTQTVLFRYTLTLEARMFCDSVFL